MFRNHQERKTRGPWLMLRPSNPTKEETKTIEKCLNQTLGKITTKETQSKTLMIFFLGECRASKGGNQVFLSQTIKTKALSISRRNVKRQYGKFFPRKISLSRLIWIFIKQKITENNSHLLLRPQVASITMRLITRSATIMRNNKELPIVLQWTRTFHTNRHCLLMPPANNNSNSNSNYQEASRSHQFKLWMNILHQGWEISKPLLMQDLALEMETNLMSMEKSEDWYLVTTVEEHLINKLWWSMQKFVRKFSLKREKLLILLNIVKRRTRVEKA